MKLSLPALREALAKHFSPQMDGAFGAALAIHLGGELPERLDVSTVGAALIEAILPASAVGAPNLALRAVELTFNGRLITLDPGEAFTHPLLRDWTPPSLGAAVSQVILAGAALTTLAAGSPVFGETWLREVSPGQIAAGATLTFRNGDARAQLLYGVAPPAAGAITFHQLTGDALFALGMESIAPPISAAFESSDSTADLRDAFAGPATETQSAATVH